jgi:hypothetical protein
MGSRTEDTAVTECFEGVEDDVELSTVASIDWARGDDPRGLIFREWRWRPTAELERVFVSILKTLRVLRLPPCELPTSALISSRYSAGKMGSLSMRTFCVIGDLTIHLCSSGK